MAKEKLDYFEYFNQVAEYACKQAEYLYETLKEYDNKTLQKNIAYMHDIEHSADTLKSKMTEQLIKEFLPPIDRDDIISLAELYDTVCDSIDDVLLKFYMYDIKNCNEDAIELSSKIVDITKKLYELTKELNGFKNPDKLLQGVIEVNKIEDIGDSLYMEAMHKLFVKKNISNNELLSWNNLYSCLEDCFDACENTADLIRNVIIKNS